MALVTIAELKSALGVGSLYTDEQLQRVCDAADLLIKDLVTPASYDDEPAPMKEAALSLAVDIFQAQRAVGGQPVGADYTPAPFRLGRSLMSKFSGLLAPYVDVEGLVS